MTKGVFDANLEALERRSPDAARALRATDHDSAYRTVISASGHAIVERAGRALDSRRDPVASADRIAATVTARRVLVAGLGGGYLAEALVRRGIEVSAIVDAEPAAILAALESRPLGDLLSRVPLVLLDARLDPVAVATLRAGAEAVVPHAAALAESAIVRALVAHWDNIRVADRAPRILVVGPIYGGSLEVARSTARALVACGAETRLFDASAYAAGYEHLGRLPLAKTTCQNWPEAALQSA